MAEDRTEPREINFRQWLPWTQLFRLFWIALDPKKLALAAAGIVVMALGWWLWAVLFYSNSHKPVYPSANYQPAAYGTKDSSEAENELKAWTAFKHDRNSWNLLFEAAGSSTDHAIVDIGDLADSLEDFQAIDKQQGEGKTEYKVPGKTYRLLQGVQGRAAYWHIAYADGTERVVPVDKPHGRLRTLPWFEERGPNPFLLVSGKAGHPGASGSARYVPWSRGEFFDWFFADQVPFLLEPLVKFIRPVAYLLHPSAGLWDQFYFLLVIATTVVVWSLFGGAITRIAAVEIARNEKIGMTEAIRYFKARWRSYLFASFAPLLGVAVLAFMLALFGAIGAIPIIGELWSGIFWFLALAVGLGMTVLLVGMVGWPMIHATLSAEGSDSFDALSRSYSYVIQKPWSYVWYVIVAVAYGAVVVFFVGLMGSLMVYLAKWGVDSMMVKNTRRDPSFMFVYAPTSFEWRELLLRASPVVDNSTEVSQAAIDNYVNTFSWWNYLGAWGVGFWLGVFFLLIVGFGYSYFWSASTMIYLLMRRKVDDTELDEVYLEEEDSEEPYTAPGAPAPPAPILASGSSPPVQMVESPTLRQATPTAPAAAAESAAPKPGDGEVTP